MGSGVAHRQPAERQDPDALLAAAGEIVVEAGLAGLTLRPLARRLGVSVTALNSHYGMRADILAAIIAAARREDEAALAPWRRRIDAVGDTGLSADMAADMVEGILDEMSGRRRAVTLLFLEMLQASGWDEAMRASFSPWLAERAAFWRLLAGRTAIPARVVDSGIVHGFVIDEAAWGVALGQAPAYRLLRRLGLRRLFGGFLAPPDGQAESRLFAALFAELDDDGSDLSVVHGAPPRSDWQARAEAASARLISRGGISAVTHRSVAAEADVRPTTLAYRYPTQEDLVVGGLQHMITRILGRVGDGRIDTRLAHQDPGYPGFDIFRATFTVAVSASRLTRLLACVADMRRRRGINLAKVLAWRRPDQRRFDALSAQAMSIGLAGLVMTMPPDTGAVVDQTESALDAAIGWAAEMS